MKIPPSFRFTISAERSSFMSSGEYSCSSQTLMFFMICVHLYLPVTVYNKLSRIYEAKFYQPFNKIRNYLLIPVSITSFPNVCMHSNTVPVCCSFNSSNNTIILARKLLSPLHSVPSVHFSKACSYHKANGS